MPPKSSKLTRNSAERQHSFDTSIEIGGKSVRWIDNNNPTIIESLVFYGFYYTPTELDLHCVTCAYCSGTESVNIDLDITPVLEDHDKHHHECYVSLAYVANTIQEHPIDFIVDYYTNQAKHISSPLLKIAFNFRLKFYGKKYIHDVKKTDNISSKSLAEAGFIYNKSSDDEVICPYCGCSFTDWESSDDPLELHQTSNDNRYCYFLDKKGVKRTILPKNNEKSVENADMSIGNLSNASNIQLEGIEFDNVQDEYDGITVANSKQDQDEHQINGADKQDDQEVHDLEDIQTDNEHFESEIPDKNLENSSKFKSPKAATTPQSYKSRATSLTPKVDPNDAYWDKPPDESLFDDLISVAKSPRLLSNKESFRELALSKATRLEHLSSRVVNLIPQDMQQDFSDFLDDPVGADLDKDDLKAREALIDRPHLINPQNVGNIASPISPEINNASSLENNTKGLSKLQVENESGVDRGKGTGKRNSKNKIAKNQRNTKIVTSHEEVKQILSQPDSIEIRPSSRRNHKNRNSKIEDSPADIENESPAVEQISNTLTKEPSVDIIKEVETTTRRKGISIEPQSNTSIDAADSLRIQDTRSNDKRFNAHTPTEMIEIPDTGTNVNNKRNSNWKQTNEKGKGTDVENSIGVEKGNDQKKEIRAKQNGKPGKRSRKIKFKARQAPVFDTSTNDVNDYGDTNLVALEENINLNPTTFDQKNTSSDSDVIMSDEFVSPIRLKSNAVLWKNMKNETNKKTSNLNESPIKSIFDKSSDDLLFEKTTIPFKSPVKADTIDSSKSSTIRSNAIDEPKRMETRNRKSKLIATSKIKKDFLEYIVNSDSETDDRYTESGSELDETGNNTEKTQIPHNSPSNVKPKERILDNLISSDHDSTQVQAASGYESELKASDLETSYEKVATSSKSNISGFVSNNAKAVEEDSDINVSSSSINEHSLSEREGTADNVDDFADYLNTVKQISANYSPNMDTMNSISSSEISTDANNEIPEAAYVESKTAVLSDSEKDKNLMDGAFKSTNAKFVSNRPIQAVSPEEKQKLDTTNIEQLGNFHGDSDVSDHFVSDVEGDAMEVFDSYVDIIDKPKPAINTKENRPSESDQIEDGFDVDNDVESPLDRSNNIDSDPIEAIFDDTVNTNDTNSPIIDNNIDIVEEIASESQIDIDNDDKFSRGTPVESITEAGSEEASEEFEKQGPESHNSSGSEVDSDNENKVGMIDGDIIEEVKKVKKVDDGIWMDSSVDGTEEKVGNKIVEKNGSKVKDLLEIVHIDNFNETRQSAITPRKSMDINRGSLDQENLQNSRITSSPNISKIHGLTAKPIPTNRKHARSSQHELPSFEPRTSIQVERDTYSPIKPENFKMLDSSTPSKDPQLGEEKRLPKSSFAEIDPVAQLLTEKQVQMKQSSDYLKSIINYEYDLHNDIESELTNFIANMPVVEAEMTVMEWVKYGAANCRRLIMEDYDLMNKMYREEYLKKLKELEDLPTID